MIVEKKVHSTETKLNALGSIDKDRSLKKIKTNLLSNWCGQKVEGFCIQDYSLVSKFYIHFKAVKGEKYQ